MPLVDELTRRIATELHRTLDQAIRQAVEDYVIGNNTPSAGVRRRGRPGRRASASRASRENRNRTIISAVAKLGEASIEDVAKATGLDKRGVGSSLHYLAAAGRLKHAGSKKYRTGRMRTV
jgi:DNA-binding IclR family transcriptional regulator